MAESSSTTSSGGARPKTTGKIDSDTKPSEKIVHAAERYVANVCRENLIMERISQEGKMIEEGPARTPLFVPCVPTKLSNGRDIDIPEMSSKSICRTPEVDTVLVGHLHTPHIYLVDGQGHHTKHRLTHGDKIKSLECISMEMSIIHVAYKNYRTPATPDSIYTCHIDLFAKTPSDIDPLNTFKVYNPLDVFRLGKNKFGVLCEDPSRIEVFKLRDIFLETKIIPTDTIFIDHTSSWHGSRACIMPDDHICVTSFHGDLVNVYTELGDKLYDLGHGPGLLEAPVTPGRLELPMTVQCDISGRIIVGCNDGEVHVLDNNTWALLKGEGGTILNSVVTNNRFWTVSGRELKMYNIT